MPEKLTLPAAEITVESLFESMEVILHETQKSFKNGLEPMRWTA